MWLDTHGYSPTEASLCILFHLSKTHPIPKEPAGTVSLKTLWAVEERAVLLTIQQTLSDTPLDSSILSVVWRSCSPNTASQKPPLVVAVYITWHIQVDLLVYLYTPCSKTVVRWHSSRLPLGNSFDGIIYSFILAINTKHLYMMDIVLSAEGFFIQQEEKNLGSHGTYYFSPFTLLMKEVSTFISKVNSFWTSVLFLILHLLVVNNANVNIFMA